LTCGPARASISPVADRRRRPFGKEQTVASSSGEERPGAPLPTCSPALGARQTRVKRSGTRVKRLPSSWSPVRGRPRHLIHGCDAPRVPTVRPPQHAAHPVETAKPPPADRQPLQPTHRARDNRGVGHKAPPTASRPTASSIVGQPLPSREPATPAPLQEADASRKEAGLARDPLVQQPRECLPEPWVAPGQRPRLQPIRKGPGFPTSAGIPTALNRLASSCSTATAPSRVMRGKRSYKRGESPQPYRCTAIEPTVLPDGPFLDADLLISKRRAAECDDSPT